MESVSGFHVEGVCHVCHVCLRAHNVQGSSTNNGIGRFNQFLSFIATTLQEHRTDTRQAHVRKSR